MERNLTINTEQKKTNLSELITFDVYNGLNSIMTRLNCMERWGTVKDNPSDNQLTKQALNCLVVRIVGMNYEKITGKKLVWTRFPKITIFRAYKNVFATADVPLSVIRRTLAKINKDESAMDEFSYSRLEFETTPEFTEFIRKGRCGIEARIYEAASKIATLVELEGISTANVKYKKEKRKEILKEIKKFYDIPGIKKMTSKKMISNLRFISTLRHQNRWATYMKPVKCSVLGHLFDTAIFSYLICLEKNMDEETATNAFFLGLFHDMGELLKKDMPSPTKDGIPGYRKASEEVEGELMEEKLYPRFSKYIADDLRNLNYELPVNAKIKEFIKGADYLSASSEIHRQVEAGARYSPYLKALVGHEKKFRKGEAVLGPNSRELFKQICAVSYNILIIYTDEKDKPFIEEMMSSIRS